MKNLLIAALVLVSFAGNAQHARIENDTAYYNTSTFYVGDTIHLGYGSNSNKDFAFVQMGSAMTGLTPLESGWAKGDVKIDKIYKASGKICMRGVMLDAPGLRALGGNKVFIAIEGSIDNKELVIN